MAHIHKLPKDLQYKIAAGEVIERPASVLKELVENSLDSGATQINVELLGGGIDRIVVSDNGSGIEREDVQVAFERFCTSKLEHEEDLFQINTLGFRGEALSSIAAVSHTVLETKTPRELVGTRIEIVGGEEKTLEECGCPDGTKVSVGRLFFNTPARKKYLKTVQTENRQCLEVVIDQAIAYPEIGFKIIAHGKVFVDVPAGQNWQERISQILTHEWREGLEVNMRQGDFGVRGYILKPEHARESRKHQYLYVNKRRVQDYLIGYKMKEAFHTLLDRNMHPAFVLNIEVPFHFVDVNVHPRKAEIKFEKPYEIYNLVKTATIAALSQQNLMPQAGVVHKQEISQDPSFVASGQLYAIQHADGWRLSDSNLETVSLSEKGEEHVLFERAESPLKFPFANHAEPLLQLYAGYIVARDEEGIVLIDQHAAQERVMYEYFMEIKQNQQKNIQMLLVPAMVELGWEEVGYLENALPVLQELGMDIEMFGEKTCIVRALPVEIVHVGVSSLVQGIIDQLIEERAKSKITEEIEKKIIMRACKISVKANETLNLQQMQKIIMDLYACKQPYTCPHGRPTIVRFRKYDLEKIFKRV